MPRSRGGEHVWENVAAAVPSVQPGQARPHAGRGRDAPGPPVPGAAGDGVGRRQRGPRARGVEAVPGDRLLTLSPSIWVVWVSSPVLGGRGLGFETVPAQMHVAHDPSVRGSAAEFHGRTIGDDPALEIWVFDVERPALVLGSTQRPDIVDAEACRASRRRGRAAAQRRRCSCCSSRATSCGSTSSCRRRNCTRPAVGDDVARVDDLARRARRCRAG